METTYSNKEIQQRAFDKIGSMYLMSTINAAEENPYWSIDQERAEAFKKRDLIDVDVYNYILTLIEKDRR